MSNTISQYTTIRLKLHHLSGVKKSAIDRGIERYSYGFRVLLKGAAAQNFPDPSDRLARNKALQAYTKSGVLEGVPVNPFKDALARQFCIQMIQGAAKPCYDMIKFYRYSGNREYCLLYDRKKGRYYAKLHVLCKEDNPFETPKQIEADRFEMVGGEIHLLSAHPRYLLAPLSFGKRQMEILEAARKGEAKIRTATLVRKQEEYYLDVCIKITTEMLHPTRTYLGVCRLESNDLSLCLCNEEGEKIFSREVDLELREEHEAIHRMANQIVHLAQGQCAQVILERLVGRSDGLERPRFSARQYLTLGRILDYKLPAAGMAPPVWVSPARLFSRCPRCGKVSSQNPTVAGAIFLCLNCGYGLEMKKLGPLNLARRLVEYRNKKIPFLKRKKGAVFEYENKRFRIRVLLPNDEALGTYLLRMVDRYERQAASLVLKIKQANSVFDVIEVIEK